MDSIIIENLTKNFNLKNKLNKSIEKRTVLDNLSFRVKRGELFGIIGLNGSGKTTLLRLIAGIYKPNIGSIKVKGRLSPLLQIGTGFNEDAEATENVILFGMLLGLTKKQILEKIDDIFRFAELDEFKKMELKHFSSGMKSRLSFSVAMHTSSEIMLFDEIFAVGDEKFRKICLDSISQLKTNDTTIILASHNLQLLSQIADTVLLIHNGKIQKIGDPKEVISEYKKIIQ